jgi:hypothetical protein
MRFVRETERRLVSDSSIWAMGLGAGKQRREDEMATLREAARLTEEIEQLAGRLHSELTDGDVDFARLTSLADDLGEAADNVATTFSQLDEILTERILGGQEGGARRSRGRRDRAQSGARRTRDESGADEGPSRDELLEKAKAAGITGRSSMTKEELEKAVGEADELSKEELLERARKAGIEGRSSMTKEELKEALQAEEGLSKEELLARARDADLPGRSEMSKEELRDALRAP